MNEAVKLGLTNGTVMQEISWCWLELGCMKQCKEALEWSIKAK